MPFPPNSFFLFFFCNVQISRDIIFVQYKQVKKNLCNLLHVVVGLGSQNHTKRVRGREGSWPGRVPAIALKSDECISEGVNVRRSDIKLYAAVVTVHFLCC